MNEPYLYQTFKQFKPDGSRPVYVQVISIAFKEAERIKYTLLNLDGNLTTSEITPADFSKLVESKVMQEWVP